MTDREKDCRRLAELAVWGFACSPRPWECDGYVVDGKNIPVPRKSARLSAHLAFVGEVAEALGQKIGMDHSECLAWCSAVCADAADIPPGDLAHAAIRAAIAALEARR